MTPSVSCLLLSWSYTISSHYLLIINETWKRYQNVTTVIMMYVNSILLTNVLQFSSSNAMNCSMPGLPVYHQLPEFTQTRVHWVSDAIQPSHPLSSPLTSHSIFPSVRGLSSESTLRMRWPKYWSFSFNISPSNEHPGLVSFRMDWLDLIAVQGTLQSLLQHHSSKASILWHSAFFTVQPSHPYLTTGKNLD